MLYSTGSATTFQAVKNVLNAFPINIQSRRIETSDPLELNEAYLRTELGLDADKESDIAAVDTRKAFARPKGPPKRR